MEKSNFPEVEALCFVIIYHYYNMFHCKDQQAKAAVVSLQRGGQWTVDYLSFICASEGQFHHKSAVIEFVSHLYWPPLEYDVTAKTKSHSQTAHSKVRA